MLQEISKIDLENLPPILLMCGEEELLVEESLNYIKLNVIDKISEEFDQDTFNAEDIDLRKLLDISKSYPFTSQKRCIIVKNAEKLFNLSSKKVDKTNVFAKYLSSPSEYTFIVFTSSYDGLNGLTKNFATKSKSLKFPFNEIVSKFEWIEYPKVWDNQQAQWVKNRLKSKKITISEPAIQLLLSNTNANLRDINNELEKLIIYINGGNNIDEEAVIASTGLSRKYNVYELQKAIGTGNIQKSLEIADNLISNDKAEMLIITVITRYFMSLMKLSEIDGNSNKYEVAAEIGVNAFFLSDYYNSLKILGINRIERAFKYLAQTDADLKSLNTDSKNLILKMIINILN